MAKTFRRTLLQALLALVPLLSMTVDGSPTTTISRLLPRENTTDATKPLNCTTEFSADYYGFGVRFGVYFAWISCYLANNFLPSEISGALDTNAIFLLALLASLFKATHKKEINQVDGLILMHLSSGFLFSSLSIWGYRTCHYKKEGPRAIRHFGKFGTHFRLALTTAIAIYGTWFWWEGVQDGLAVSEKEGCDQVYTWFFGKWNIAGGVHYLYIVMAFSTAIYYSGMCLASVAALTLRLFKVGLKQKLRAKLETGLHPTELYLLFIINRVWNFFWLIICIIMIELTLSANHMMNTLAQNGNIAYPAQLLPLIVGVLSFVRVCWLIYAEKSEACRERKKAEREAAQQAAGDECEAEGWGSVTPATPTGGKLLNRFSTGSSIGLGLGLKHFFSPNLDRTRTPPATPTPAMLSAEVHAESNAARHRWHRRYCIAWLPWLSLFAFWHKHGRNCDVEVASPLAEIKTEYAGAAEDVKEKLTVHTLELEQNGEHMEIMSGE